MSAVQRVLKFTGHCLLPLQGTAARRISTANKYIPRRAVLYVPGNDERKLRKIPGLRADCIVLDCEDGVALNRKAEARKTIRDVLSSGLINFGRSDCSVRFNSVDSGLCEEDMKVILTGDKLPATILLPKVESPENVQWFAERLRNIVPSDSKVSFRLVMYIESARSMLNLPAICQKAVEMSSSSPFIPDGLIIGSDDLLADIGATRSNEARELIYARQYFVMVAKAFRLQAIDLVYIDYKDLDGLKRQSVEGAHFGFTGKQVIHPGQVPVVQESYTPSTEKVEWARQLIDAFEQHQQSGKGAFTFRGHMIDMPSVLQAKNVVDMMEALGNA